MIYIVRHGQTDWNTIGRIQGWQDIELNGRGIEQARIIREKLKDVEFDEVISSPLKRALRTAKEITGRKYKDIKKDKRILSETGMVLHTSLSKAICPQISTEQIHVSPNIH